MEAPNTGYGGVPIWPPMTWQQGGWKPAPEGIALPQPQYMPSGHVQAPVNEPVYITAGPVRRRPGREIGEGGGRDGS